MKHGAIYFFPLKRKETWVPMVDSIKTSWSWISFTHSNLFPPLQLWFWPIHPPGFCMPKNHREKEHRCWVTPPNAAQLPPSWVSRKNVSRPKARYTKRCLWNRGRHFWIWAKDLIYIFENNGKNKTWKKGTQTLVVARFFFVAKCFFWWGGSWLFRFLFGERLYHAIYQTTKGCWTSTPPRIYMGISGQSSFCLTGNFSTIFRFPKKIHRIFLKGDFLGWDF